VTGPVWKVGTLVERPQPVVRTCRVARGPCLFGSEQFLNLLKQQGVRPDVIDSSVGACFLLVQH
jgi:hypothetical protein